MIVQVMGVAGVGKTTIGAALARELGWRFIDADDYHPPQNVAKMKAGIPLEDADRWPWLAHLNKALKEEENAVLACSALKHAYRERLRVSDDVKFVFLRGDYALVEKQLRHRPAHFMNPELLRSQFTDLEEPGPDEKTLTIELGRTPQELVSEIKTKLRPARKG